MRVISSSRAMGSLEFIVCLGVIFFLSFVSLIYLNATALRAKELVLNSELRNMRIALNLYRGINGEYPNDLREMAVKEIDWTKVAHEVYKRRYLEHQRVDKKGFPIDPWGNRFSYQPSSGILHSSTKGYEKW